MPSARPSSCQTEHFARRRQVAEHDAVERNDGDQVRPSACAGRGVNPAIIVF
jgi:hypothetical protein